jgi:peptidoglycan/LPS O-acetylase OafA/YrhL
VSRRRAEPDKLRYIDALRGWAILLVVLTHASQGQMAVDALHQAVPQSAVLALPDWLHQICAYAGYGVHLFFVVSALSLALSWQARGERDLSGVRDYLIRRFFRIAPMFYAGIALYLALYGWGPRLYAPNGIGPLDVALTLGFIHIWSTNAMNSVMPGDWSIGVEAMFYLILPLLLMFGRTTIRLAALTVGFVLLAQTLYWIDTGFGPFGIPGFPSQAAVFPFGLIAASVVRRPTGRPRAGHTLRGLAAAALFLFLVAGLPLAHLPESFLVYSVQFAAGVGLLCILLHQAPVPLLVNWLLARIGRISFSMYILHFALFAPVFAVARALAGAIDSSSGDTFLLAVYYPLLVAATAACAAGTYAAIERPGIRLGRLIIARLHRLGAVVQRPA